MLGHWFGDSEAEDASNDAGRSMTYLTSNRATILNQKELVEISSVFKVAVCQHDVPIGGIGWQKMYAQVFTDGLGWDHFFTMKSKAKAGNTLDMLVQEQQWIPQVIITDGFMEQKGGTWSNVRKKWGIQQCYTEPYSPWQNHVEKSILEIKMAIKWFTRQSG